jgi:3-phosphoshikimate 1-carboxyvinyltransferase
MGAKISAVDDQFAPLSITGGQTLRAIEYAMPMASAQVKSAILLASLYAEKPSLITTPGVCRDHTEIMLEYLQTIPDGCKQIHLNIPGDISAAAFFIVGAIITPGSDITLPNIGINPTRTAVIDILRDMGADIAVKNVKSLHGELRADLHVRYSQPLHGIEVPIESIPNAIDEIPALCLAAACAKGATVIRGAQELRYKESDRIAMLTAGFRRLGITVNEFADGLAITGGVISGGEVASGGDHRIAMTFAMAGLVAQQPVIVQDTDNIATSFPSFVATAAAAGLQIEERDLCLIPQ